MTPEEREAEYEAFEQRRLQEEAEMMPLSKTQLKALFDWLMRSDAPTCDHTRNQTVEFLASQNLDVDGVLAWLRRNGGYCDCEIIFNVEYRFRDIVTS